MTGKQWTKLAERASWELDSLANECGNGAGRYMERAFAESERVEREHRAFGRRFTDGRAAYRLSVMTASRLMVCREVARTLAQLEGAGERDEHVKGPATWTDAAGTRADIVQARALAESLHAAWPSRESPGRPRFDAETRAACLAFDYARDAAHAAGSK